MARNPKTPFPKLCVECKHSARIPGNPQDLRCMNPLVNWIDPQALARAEPRGSDTLYERSKYGLLGCGMCGMRGALWEPREQADETTL